MRLYGGRDLLDSVIKSVVEHNITSPMPVCSVW